MLHHAYLSGDLAKFKKLTSKQGSGLASGATSELSSSFKSGYHQLSSSLQKIKNASSGNIDINQTDFEGRTVLHLAASDGNVAFAQQCLLNDNLNVTKPDAESGWTALHRALYNGRIEIAGSILGHSPLRDGAVNKNALTATDHEGNSAFDVYNATVPGVSPNRFSDQRGGSDLFTFGSNVNHTLGFADSDDRALPERVAIKRPHIMREGVQKFRALRIRDLSMQKLHTLVLTADAVDNLYACGFANHGRLGMSGGTQFTLKPIAMSGQVTAIAAAQDHSLAIMSNGDLYAWGAAKYGQLGCDVDLKGPDAFVAAPRKVNKLAKERVVGVAASLCHSVCFTQEALFTWGSNEGQLGYDIVPSEGNIVSLPRKVTALKTAVLQVAATRRATACLLVTREVVILTNFGYFRLPLQLDQSPSRLSVFRPRSQAAAEVVKVTCGATVFALLTSVGDVFTFSIDESANGIKPVQLAKQIKVSRAWAPRKNHLAARDVDVGQEGQLIICTEGGLVFAGSFRKGNKYRPDPSGRLYKYTRVAKTTRIVQVRANDNGAFGLLRDDVDVLPVPLESPTLAEDLLCTLPYADSILDDEETENLPQTDLGSDAGSDVCDPQHVINALAFIKQPKFTANWLVEVDEPDIAMFLGGRAFPAPKALLCVRSSVLARIILHGESHSELVFDGDRITLPARFSFVALTVVMHWMLTDFLLTTWTGGAYHQPAHLKGVRDDVQKLAQLLQLKPLNKAMASSFVTAPKPTLASDCLSLLQDPLDATADSRLVLSDGELLCHASIITARSEFFSAMYEGAWLNQRRLDSDATIVDIDVKHISKQTMQYVLTHIYGDVDTALFDEVEVGELDELLEIVLSVLAAATELILPRLREACQAVLARYVHRKNVAALLHEADIYNAEELKESCLDYCARNLQLMLENGLLQDLSSSLMHELELLVARKQLQKLPTSKSGRLLSELIQRRPSVLEEIETAKARYLKSLLLPVNQDVLATRNAILTSASLQRQLSEQQSRSAGPSPLVRATRQGDDSIFAMEDYDLSELDNRTSSLQLDDSRFQIQSRPVQSQPSERRASPLQSPLAGSASGNSRSSLAQVTGQASRINPAATRNWTTKSVAAPVVDLRSIISPSSQPLKPMPAISKTPDAAIKVSQKERKKMAQAAQSSPALLSNEGTSAPVSTSPWGAAKTLATTQSAAGQVTSKNQGVFPSLRSADIRQKPQPQFTAARSSTSSSSARPLSAGVQPIAVPAPLLRTSVAGRADCGSLGSPGSPAMRSTPTPTKASLANIIAQETDKKVRTAEFQAKRSLKEIQDQEESERFERWFASESLRIQKQDRQAAAPSASGSAPKSGQKGREQGRSKQRAKQGNAKGKDSNRAKAEAASVPPAGQMEGSKTEGALTVASGQPATTPVRLQPTAEAFKPQVYQEK